MELKFIWIEKYKNIKKTGFNFNHSINEVFAFTNNKLVISPKLNNPPKNFFKNNISSITAIVGKNGSGKTNLTEFINYNLAHATNGGLSTYIRSNGICIVDKWIFIQKEIKLKNENYLKNLGYVILRFKDAPLDLRNGELRWHKMEKNKYIYYNPTFDLRGIPVRDNLVNISTTMLVYNDMYNSEKLYGYSVSEESNISQLNAFENMEKSRICDFILNFEKAYNYIDFLPDELKITIDTDKNNYFLKKKYYYGGQLNDPKNITINTLQNELDNLESYELSGYNYEKYFVRNPENSINRYYNIPIQEQKDIFFRLFFIKIFQGLLNNNVFFPNDYFRRFLYHEVQNEQMEDLQSQDLILKLKEKILKIIANADWLEFDFPLSEERYAEVHIRNSQIYEYLGSIVISIAENKILLNDTISLMDKLLEQKRIFTYETSNEFSSGQKHLLTLYSRFFWASNQINKSEIGDYAIKGESIIIFIDEGEVTLHPEWQRIFFNKVTSYLNELFIDKKIQLILTTHSPFVLSDIPKDNVLFLERDANGFAMISNIERENTFGANIYSLLCDSFFMENTMGKFAELKLKESLEILTSNHNDYSPEKINELIYIIGSIGEPIIKEQFEYLYKKKFVNDEVNILRNRIIQLENQLKQKRDDFDNN